MHLHHPVYRLTNYTQYTALPPPYNDADEEASSFAFTTAHNFQAVTWDRVKVATQSDKSIYIRIHQINNN